MDDSEPKSDGWLDSLRRMGDSLLGLIQTRFELAGVELREEKLRTIQLFVWVAVAIALGTAGLLVGMGALGLFLWEKAGYAGLIGLAVLAVAGAAGILHAIYRRLHTMPIPFSETIAEFKKDKECLGPKK